MKKLEPTDLFAIPIPKDFKGFSFTEFLKDVSFNFELLGTVTKEVIDFDVEPFVERIIDNSIPNDLIYRDYTDDGKMKIDPITRSKSVLLGFYECGQKEESIKLSFYSLLKINKIYFVENENYLIIKRA